VKSRMRKLGRSLEHLRVLPGALVVVGDTVDEARKKKTLLDSLVHPDSGLASLSIALGCDATNFDLDGPLPEIPASNASKSGQERFITLAKRDNLTVRQLVQIAGSFSGLTFVGTPATIADEMEQWLFEEGCSFQQVLRSEWTGL
jgi:alkanesulfonate monooxygenase SsuD/methylene tetrahydromethanopterin reductase-like flavin-dependent oxidoreductase (luciferase family)